MPRFRQNKVIKEKKALITVNAFLPKDKEIHRIIKYCSFSCDDDWRIWHDEHNNIINFDRTEILLSLNQNNHVATKDIYYCSSSKMIIEKSIGASITYLNNKDAYIWLLGKDNKLRVLKYSTIHLTNNILPISLGLTAVRKAIKKLKKLPFSIETRELLEKENKLFKKIIDCELNV